MELEVLVQSLQPLLLAVLYRTKATCRPSTGVV